MQLSDFGIEGLTAEKLEEMSREECCAAFGPALLTMVQDSLASAAHPLYNRADLLERMRFVSVAIDGTDPSRSSNSWLGTRRQ